MTRMQGTREWMVACAILVGSSLGAIHCSNDDSGGSPSTTPADTGGDPGSGGGTGNPAGGYKIGGTVTGLAGSGLVLQDNAGDNLTLTDNGAFTFATAVSDSGAYAVTVLTQPLSPAQTCNVIGGSGTVQGADVSDVSIACMTNDYKVGGTVTGLSGTIVLVDNDGDPLTVGADGPFTFATPVPSGAPYDVTIQSQPPGQSCSVSGATAVIGAGDTSSIVVNCAPDKYTVGGTVSGLSGTLVLRDNGGNDLTVSANGTFAFTGTLAAGSAYDVEVETQPSGRTCTISSGTGTIQSGNVTTVAIECSASP